MDPAAALANRIFERQAWAQERLAAHAGRVFLVTVGPFASAMRIDESGRLEAASRAEALADLTLTLSPFAVPPFLANPARWDDYVTSSGDPGLAATLKDLAQTLPWFAEQAFADTLGPIVGRRVADLGRALLAFPQHAAERVGESVASYARDESGLATAAPQVRSFAEDTAALAARVDALAPRIDALAARVARHERAPTPRKQG